MNSLVLVSLFVVLAVLLQIGALHFSASLWQLPKRNWARVWVAVLARIVIFLGLFSMIAWLTTVPGSLPVALVLFLFDASVSVLLISRVFGCRSSAALGTCISTLVLGGITTIVMVLGFSELCVQYKLVSSAMSPNLRGYHTVEVLPNGNHLIHAANYPGDAHGIAPGGPSGAIVAETYEYREVSRPATHTHVADRFLCNKTKFPNRWDATVFRNPMEPKNISIKRLVGLPGERLDIRDGAVWIDGERLNPPDRLGPIHYSSLSEVTLPIVLGADEYFLLGDNTQRTADSRIWGPVKRELILGVADVICWPPSRWKLNP